MKLRQIITLFIATIVGVSCVTSGGDIVKQYVDDVWNNHNTEALGKYVERTYIRKAALFPRLGKEQEQQLRHRGIEGWRNYLNRIFNNIPDLHVELTDIIAEGNQVYATVLTTGTQLKSSWGSATGKHFESRCATHYRLSENSGKIAFTEMFCDFAGLMQYFAPSPINVGNFHQGRVSDRDQNRFTHGLTMDNLHSGIESILAGKILALGHAYNSRKPKALILPLHDTKMYKAISPAYPDGFNAHEEVDFFLGWSKCMTNDKTQAKVELQRFYFDKLGRGVTVSWTMKGVFGSKCPAPYDQFAPTNKPFALTGISYHRFNENGLLQEKITVYDNEYVNKALKGMPDAVEA
jgi:predicted ester cyclase